MPYFKTLTYTLALSQKEAETCLSNLTRQHKQKSTNTKQNIIYKGHILPNSFELSMNRSFQIIKLKGSIKNRGDSQLQLQLDGHIEWKNLLVNALLFLSVAAALLLLCTLLFQVSILQGIAASIVAAFLGHGLFQNLIGRLRSNYKKMCADLIHLLSVYKQLN